MKKIFLATSFSGQVDDKGKILPEYRSFVENIIIALRQNYEVFCAAEHEGWQYYHATAEEGVKKDLEEIDKADALVAILHPKMSGGLHIEIGFAVGKDKATILVTADTDLRYFNQGLVKVGKANHLIYKNPEDLAVAINKLVK